MLVNTKIIGDFGLYEIPSWAVARNALKFRPRPFFLEQSFLPKPENKKPLSLGPKF
jgi:hypothetical protein